MTQPPTIRQKLLDLLRSGAQVKPADIAAVIEGYERDLAAYGTRPTVAEWQDKVRECDELRERCAMLVEALDAASADAELAATTPPGVTGASPDFFDRLSTALGVDSNDPRDRDPSVLLELAAVTTAGFRNLMEHGAKLRVRVDELEAANKHLHADRLRVESFALRIGEALGLDGSFSWDQLFEEARKVREALDELVPDARDAASAA